MFELVYPRDSREDNTNISGTTVKESMLGFYDVSSILLPRRFKVVDKRTGFQTNHGY